MTLGLVLVYAIFGTATALSVLDDVDRWRASGQLNDVSNPLTDRVTAAIIGILWPGWWLVKLRDKARAWNQ